MLESTFKAIIILYGKLPPIFDITIQIGQTSHGYHTCP
jgi:hypothetical protein